MKRSGIGRVLRMGSAIPRQRLRILGAAALTLLFLWLLRQRLASLDLAEVMQAFAAVSLGHWALALAATALSFWAVGQYDASLHRHLSTGQSPPHTRHAGMAAIALGQTLGLGILTGALVRWRMLPALSLIEATKLSAAVALSFLFGWSMVTAMVLLALPDAPLKPLALVACAAGGIATALCLLQPGLHILGRKIALPNLFTLWQILAFSLVDTFAAAFALWLLCPPDLALPFAALLPAYLLALGAGLLSGTPGGVGAFEMTLLAALPMVPEPGLIAGVLAFRLAYYALPAVLAALAALVLPLPAPPQLTPRTLHHNAPAEAGLVAQSHIQMVSFPHHSQALIGETSHAVVMLLDPFGPPDMAQDLRALRALAKARSRIACLYKCGPQLAATARAAGWHVAPVAAEAWLNPTSFTLDGPEKSALRRKLRKAEKAGLHIRELTAADWQAQPSPLAEINHEWAQDNGGERGFSMGRFAPAHIAAQRVFGAFSQGRLCAFISFHHNSHEWALDLMRHRAATPDGTNYALIVHALQAARRAGITRFSLAAAPRLPNPGPLLRRFVAQSNCLSRWLASWMPGWGPNGVPNGLCQFKSSFAPLWQPLYIAAPNRAALVLAGAEIFRAIHAPPPLAGAGGQAGHKQNKIASNGQPWQTRVK